MVNNRYPKIYIRSKSNLAHQLTDRFFSYKKSSHLINDVLKNFDLYWSDNKRQSQPQKSKYVRNAKHTPLGLLLKKLNKMVLAPHDNMLPNYIFGGVKGLDNVSAVIHLLGKQRKRSVLSLDITRFFEQVEVERVQNFFLNKCQCSYKMAKMMANFCCVNEGPKGSETERKTLARGFATSSRLAIWCNLDIFIKLNSLFGN